MLDWTVLLLAIPAVLLAGISKGGFGSGISFVSVAILAVVLEPGIALALMLPLLMVMDVASLKPYWGKWDWAMARLLILGGVPGAVLGAMLFTVVDDDVIRVLIGSIALLYPLIEGARARGWLAPRVARPRPIFGLIAGLVAGFTSFISHAGGPPVAIYMLSQPQVDKTSYQASTVLIFWIINLVKSALYAVIGVFTLNMLAHSAILVPVALLGTWIGVRAHNLISPQLFFRVTYGALLLTGAKLLWDGLT
ncbi:MAG: putative membrane protein YfcA [Paracoccaceae bacterium]